MQYYSQFGEDSWVISNLPMPKEGTFMDIGAWDGVESSNTLAFEEMGWFGMCVEPVQSAWDKCNYRRKCLCFNLAASNRCSHREFHLNGTAPGLSGFKAEGGIILRLSTVRADQLWYGFPQLHLLSIDTEGSELEVWEGAKSLKPKIVIVEFWTQPHPPQDKEIVEQFTKDGYREVHRTEANLIFTLT